MLETQMAIIKCLIIQASMLVLVSTDATTTNRSTPSLEMHMEAANWTSTRNANYTETAWNQGTILSNRLFGYESTSLSPDMAVNNNRLVTIKTLQLNMLAWLPVPTLGLTFNIMVIIVVKRSHKLTGSVPCLMISLAVGDIFYSALLLPPALYRSITGELTQ